MALEHHPDIDVSERVLQLLGAWSRNDGEALGRLYHDDATHRGPGVALLYPEYADATLRGKSAIEDFVSRIAAADLGEVTMQITWAHESGPFSITEYDVNFPAGGHAHWAEVDEWDGDRVRHVRAYDLAIE